MQRQALELELERAKARARSRRKIQNATNFGFLFYPFFRSKWMLINNIDKKVDLTKKQ